jgi:hypothetical protein
MANLSLLGRRGPPKFIKAYIKPIVDLFMNSMVSTEKHIEKTISIEILL